MKIYTPWDKLKLKEWVKASQVDRIFYCFFILGERV